MNGCEILTLLIHLIELNNNNNIRTVNRTDRQYTQGAVIFIGNSPCTATTLQCEIVDLTKSLIIKTTNTDFPDSKYYKPTKKPIKPWYMEASEKGGNKKRKPFIK